MNTRAVPDAPRPFFLDGSAGALFALHLPAAGAAATREAVLLFPPFAEEMNKCRRQVMLQARAFAASGRDVLLLDLHGTGESAGDFGDARWDVWIDDLERGARWLLERGAGSLCFWGIRLGAMQAFALAGGALSSQVSRLLLWQPVVNGKGFFTQFLRLRMAAQLNTGDSGETTASLREQLAGGESLEVAGYTVSPELAGSIDALNLKTELPAISCPVDWVEFSTRGKGLTPASKAMVAALEGAGVTVATHAVEGEPFWNTPETTTVDGLASSGVAMLGAKAA
ncbi:MAG: hydrolase 2, exosortase A system-associated [Pseudomonadota bacterium]